MLLTIQDPNFLLPTVTNGAFTDPTTGVPWTYTLSQILVCDTAWGALPSPPPGGGQAQCVLFRSAGSEGSASQTIDFGAGGPCTISGFASQYQSQAGILDVLVDGDVVYTLTPGVAWASFTSAPFTVSAGSHLLTVAAHAQAGDNSFLLTGVAVDLQTPDPPPSNTVARPPKWVPRRPSRRR
jgi:hypothetical protein